ncbi:hypothetical protein ACFWAR_19615 [Streptomyces sp. NPDC059917]|uniref:hypothetical protein n=1 Tax=Streptomyces sp. NPDC059917 TaxID=3347002 RepID=UPI00364F8575
MSASRKAAWPGEGGCMAGAEGALEAQERLRAIGAAYLQDLAARRENDQRPEDPAEDPVSDER